MLFSRLVTLACALLVLSVLVIFVAGLSAFVSMPRLEDPRIVNRNPLIVTLVPGASAERVEALVTEKLEEELQEVPEIKEIRSTSRAGGYGSWIRTTTRLLSRQPPPTRPCFHCAWSRTARS